MLGCFVRRNDWAQKIQYGWFMLAAFSAAGGGCPDHPAAACVGQVSYRLLAADDDLEAADSSLRADLSDCNDCGVRCVDLVWYLPGAGLENTAYPDQLQRRCAELLVQGLTELTRDHMQQTAQAPRRRPAWLRTVRLRFAGLTEEERRRVWDTLRGADPQDTQSCWAWLRCVVERWCRGSEASGLLHRMEQQWSAVATREALILSKASLGEEGDMAQRERADATPCSDGGSKDDPEWAHADQLLSRLDVLAAKGTHGTQEFDLLRCQTLVQTLGTELLTGKCKLVDPHAPAALGINMFVHHALVARLLGIADFAVKRQRIAAREPYRVLLQISWPAQLASYLATLTGFELAARQHHETTGDWLETIKTTEDDDIFELVVDPRVEVVSAGTLRVVVSGGRVTEPGRDFEFLQFSQLWPGGVVLELRLWHRGLHPDGSPQLLQLIIPGRRRHGKGRAHLLAPTPSEPVRVAALAKDATRWVLPALAGIALDRIVTVFDFNMQRTMNPQDNWANDETLRHRVAADPEYLRRYLPCAGDYYLHPVWDDRSRFFPGPDFALVFFDGSDSVNELTQRPGPTLSDADVMRHFGYRVYEAPGGSLLRSDGVQQDYYTHLSASKQLVIRHHLEVALGTGEGVYREGFMWYRQSQDRR